MAVVLDYEYGSAAGDFVYVGTGYKPFLGHAMGRDAKSKYDRRSAGPDEVRYRRLDLRYRRGRPDIEAGGEQSPRHEMDVGVGKSRQEALLTKHNRGET